MKKLFGNTNGLNRTQIHRIETLYHCRVQPELILSPQIITRVCAISHEINRQIGLLIHRSGKITAVIVGDHREIMLPDTSQYRTPPGRLKGLRCIHTHIKKDEQLSLDDLNDLTLLRLDLMGAITLTDDGRPYQFHLAHILPDQSLKHPYRIHPPMAPDRLSINCLELVKAIETELSKIQSVHDVEAGVERAILISVTTSPKHRAETSLAELRELAQSCGIHVLDSVIQHRKQIDPRFLLGRGRLAELTVLAMQKGATLLVFDQELNPSQVRSITNRIEMKVIDRTQLILDIFAQRAQTREGKLQVELAQLRYLLPRLITKNTAMSRLTGGIGGRGPGETKLEINRRRIRRRISGIEKSLNHVRKQRRLQRAKREKTGLPVISIIGYTNAGKSTLLNTLTRSRVPVENRLFATLDPYSRRMKFPADKEVIITDTVGFIRDLPKELRVAFRATLEELETADLLLHVIDISNSDYGAHIESVNKIVQALGLDHIRRIMVLNKRDLVTPETAARIMAETGGIPISANEAASLTPLIERMESIIGGIGRDTNRVA